MKAFTLESMAIVLFIVFRPGFSESPFLLSSMPSNEIPSTSSSSERTASNVKVSSSASSNGIWLDPASTALTPIGTFILGQASVSSSPFTPLIHFISIPSDTPIITPKIYEKDNIVQDNETASNHVEFPDNETSSSHVELTDNETLSSHVELTGNETSSNLTSFPDNETASSHASFPDNETLSSHASFPDNETLSSHASFPDNETSSSHVELTDNETSSSHASFPDNETSSSHASFPDNETSSNLTSFPDNETSSSHASFPDNETLSSHASFPDNETSSSSSVPESAVNHHTILDWPSTTLRRKIIDVEHSVCGNNICAPFLANSGKWQTADSCPVCHCDVGCIRFGDCCPDVYLMKIATYKENNGVYKCLHTNRGNTMVIYRCPPVSISDINDNKTSKISTQRRKCEQPDVSKLDEAVLVHDMSTQTSYRNVHCSRCHNANSSNIRQWKLKVHCKHGNSRLDRYKNNQTELYYQIMRGELRGICDVTYDYENKRYVRRCKKPAGDIITRCNHTGELSPIFYDADIDQACQMYTSVFKHEYKNMFCFMCNKNRFWSINDMRGKHESIAGGSSTGNVARLTFSALINLDSDVDKTNYDNDKYNRLAQCSSAQFFDNATCSCKDIMCSPLQNFDPENNTCLDVHFSGLSLGYRACLRVYVDFNTAPNTVSILSLSNALSSLLPTIRLMVTMSQWCPGDTRLIIHLDTWAVDGQYGEHDFAFEKTFYADGNVFCDFMQKQRSVYSSIDSCEFEMVDKTECPAYNHFNKTCKLYETFQVRPTVVVNIAALKLYSYSEYHFEGNGTRRTYMSRDDLYNIPPYEVLVIKDNVGGKILFRPYKRIEHCTFVDLSVGDLNVTGNMIVHRASLQSVKAMNVRFTQNDTVVSICLQDYLRWNLGDTRNCYHARANTYNDSLLDDWTIGGVISIVSSCISLFFLLLTFLTYLLFDNIRTRGGVSIMLLTVLLFIAQALYEFAIELYDIQMLCSLFGVLIHFFWLASLFSMNACSIERFTKLCFPLQSISIFATKKPTVIAMLYTFMCPLVIVGINIVVNVITKNQIGYGSSLICYINGKYSRIYAFVMPMCVILVINGVLLGITIIKLRRQSLVGNAQNNVSGAKIGLVACVRLSTVTGGTWLISLLYEVIPIEALGYVFTAFLGLQGVVLFFSLLGNRSVLELYVQALKAKARPPKSTQKITTMTNDSAEGMKQMERDKDKMKDRSNEKGQK